MEKSGNLKVVGNNLGGCVLDCGVLLVSNFIRKVESVPDTLSKHLKKFRGESCRCESGHPVNWFYAWRTIV